MGVWDAAQVDRHTVGRLEVDGGQHTFTRVHGRLLVRRIGGSRLSVRLPFATGIFYSISGEWRREKVVPLKNDTAHAGGHIFNPQNWIDAFDAGADEMACLDFAI